MQEVFYIFGAVIIISLISFIGALGLIRKKLLEKAIFILVAFAAGAFIGSAFFDLIPESFEALGNFYFVIVGIVLFFLVESFLHWHHHEGGCKKCLKPSVHLTLIGDSLHNFIDGVLIAAGFLHGIASGILISAAIAVHEIPQEIGDFAILVQGGLSKLKALFFNFFSALTAVLGAFGGYLFLSRVENFIPYIIAIAAGGFIYVAGADLIPELHKEKNFKKILLQILFLILGIALIGFIFSFFPE